MPKPLLENFDYRVECDDFLLYELGRLIEDDRASLEDAEFRRVIDAGIHEHVERRLDIRAQMAERLRTGGAADRLLRAIEDIESPLRDIPQIIQSYAAYLFQRLEYCAEESPNEKLTTAADLLLESPEDREAAQTSIGILASTPSAVSARVLAHVISEPLLEEDLEMKAYSALRSMWPLPRHYMLYSLKPHSHEDIPFRWFQLLVECNEPSATDRILEEILVHGDDPDYREDLLALVQLLDKAGDPETEDKVLQVLNSENLPRSVSGVLEQFLRNTETQRHRERRDDDPWAQLERAYAANRRYLAATRLFDAGKKAEAKLAIEELLKEDPQYPFALMLRDML